MKISKDMSVKLTNFSSRVASFSESIEKLESDVANLKDKVSEVSTVDKLVADIGSVSTEAKSISNECTSLSDGVKDEVKDEATESELASFTRKMRIIARNFNCIADGLDNISTEAKSVTEVELPNSSDANLNTEVSAQTEATSTSEYVEFSSNQFVELTVSGIIKSFAEIKDDVDNSGDLVKEVTDQVVIEPAISNKEVKDELKNEIKEEVMNEVKDAVQAQPTVPDSVVIPPAQGNNPVASNVEGDMSTQEGEGEEMKVKLPEETQEDVNLENLELKEFTEAQSLYNFAVEALKETDEDTRKELVDELVTKVEKSELSEDGKEALVEAIEEASSEMANFNELKNICCGAMDKVCEGKEVDTDELAKACSELDKKVPGAGSAIVEICEKFCKALAGVKGEEFCGTQTVSFSEEIDAFIGVPLADRSMEIRAKAKCLELKDAIEEEDPDLNKVGEKATEVAEAIKDMDDPEVKEFACKLIQFAEELDATLAGEAEVSPDSAAVAEDITGSDKEINEVIEVMDSKLDDGLTPETVTFARKYLNSIKSMKCFSEEDVVAKLDQVDEAKKLLEEAGVAFDSDLKGVEKNTVDGEVKTEEVKTEEVKGEEPKAEEVKTEVVEKCPVCDKTPCECTKTEEVKTEEVKGEEPKAEEVKEEVSKLVDEPKVDESELPSDSSVKNFSTNANKGKEFDPLSYLVGLNIR